MSAIQRFHSTIFQDDDAPKRNERYPTWICTVTLTQVPYIVHNYALVGDYRYQTCYSETSEWRVPTGLKKFVLY